jgi:hypothetical protein
MRDEFRAIGQAAAAARDANPQGGLDDDMEFVGNPDDALAIQFTPPAAEIPSAEDQAAAATHEAAVAQVANEVADNEVAAVAPLAQPDIFDDSDVEEP